jgi:hypothetical protein
LEGGVPKELRDRNSLIAIEVPMTPVHASVEKLNEVLRPMWRRFVDGIVQDVPEDVSLCEFDCRNGQCTSSEWAICERRLQKASGELMPNAKLVDAKKRNAA